MFVPTKLSQYKQKSIKPIVSNSIWDQLISNHGGLLPHTKTLISGDPGIGKSTVLLHLISLFKKQGFKPLFISAEMGKETVKKYANRFNDINDLDIMFTDEYVGVEFEVIDVMLESGEYDVVLIDSWAQLLKLIPQISEIELLNLFDYYSDNYSTSFLFIQQVTKDNKLAGKNYLKHMVDNVMALRRDPKIKDISFIEYDKNRDGEVNKKLYFKIANNDIQYTFEQPKVPLSESEKLKMEIIVRKLKKNRGGFVDHLSIMSYLNITKDDAWELFKKVNS